MILPPQETRGNIWGHPWLSRLGVLLASSGWGSCSTPHSTQDGRPQRVTLLGCYHCQGWDHNLELHWDKPPPGGHDCSVEAHSGDIASLLCQLRPRRNRCLGCLCQTQGHMTTGCWGQISRETSEESGDKLKHSRLETEQATLKGLCLQDPSCSPVRKLLFSRTRNARSLQKTCLCSRRKGPSP